MNDTLTGTLMAALLMTIPAAGQAALQSTTLDKVTIGSSVFDVTFTLDSDFTTRFDDVFGTGIPTLPFTEQSEALAAVQAIVGAVNAAGFDVIGGSRSNGFVLPFSVGASTFQHFTGWASDPAYGTNVFGPFSHQRATTDYYVAFATLERAGNVAEPTTLALLGFGALGVAGLRRRSG